MKKKSDWKSYVPPLVQAYNATKSDATGYSPHYLMFGWHPRLSVDTFLGIGEPGNGHDGSRESYVQRLRQRLDYAYKTASKVAGKQAEQNKAAYDARIRESKLCVGDRVLVRKVGLLGRQKLADRWKQDPYRVASAEVDGLPVYRVQTEDGSGAMRTLHRNMLLPFTTIPADHEHEAGTNRKVCPNKARKVKVRSDMEISSEESEESSSDSDRYVIPQRRNQKGTLNVNPNGGPRPVRSPRVSLVSDPLSPDLSSPTPDSTELSPPVSDMEMSPIPPEVLIIDPATTGEGPPLTDIDEEPGSGIVDAVPAGTRRSGRTRNPPDRYGVWVNPQLVPKPFDEFF